MRSTSFVSASVARFLALGVIPLIAVGVFGAAQIASLQREAVGYRNAVLAENVRAEAEAFLTAPEIALVQFSHHTDHQTMLQRQPAETLTDHLPMLESVAVIDPSGRAAAASSLPDSGVDANDVLGLDYSRDPLYLAARETTEPVWSGVFTSAASGRRVLGLAIAAADQVVLATVGIESLARDVNALNPEQGTRVVVTDKAGTVLFHSDPEVAEARPNLANVRPIAAGLAGRTGTYRYDVDGQEMLGSTALVAGADWVVLVERSWADANLPVVAARSAISLFVVVVALAAVSAAIVFAQGLSRPVVEISEDALRMAQGDYRASDTTYRHRELEMLADSVRATAAAVASREADLARSRSALEEINLRLAHALDEQAEANDRLASMSAELSIAEERERRRLAEELHDRVSQSLAVARMRLGMAAGSKPFDTDNAAAALRLLTDAIAESRAITNELAPPILYELGLGAALREMADRVAASHGTRVTVEVVGEEPSFSDEVRTLLLRSARELVVNAAKYSGVQEVMVRLSSSDTEVFLAVEDEGAGFDVDSVHASGSSGFGLFSIRQRLQYVGGRCEIVTAPGEGTHVSISVPIG